ncbi:MAG TPA: preprotein translocase subunit SecE [Candidatus Binataceae bacterium]|jgi:preprotein translocase subunit SecE|nr:preprotein translocase subunit SecE [Candidatus Binataceae bacterium]
MAKLKNYLEQGVNFVKEAWTELAKVHFPSPKETMQATVVVLVLTIVMAIWLGLIDLAATRVVRQILS